MEEKDYEAILSAMAPTVTAQGFVPVAGEAHTFRNGQKAFRLRYGEDRCVKLETADLEDGAVSDYTVAASWLFDDTHTESDLPVIAEDFEHALLKALGVAPVTAGGSEISLPGKTGAGQTPNIEGLTQKMLAVYPECKEIYKAELAQNGEFLYVDFFLKQIVPRVRGTVETGGKKQVSKLMDILGKLYYEGDGTVSNVVVAVIIAGVFRDRPADYERCCAYLSDYPYLKSAGDGILKLARRNRKYAAFLAR